MREGMTKIDWIRLFHIECTVSCQSACFAKLTGFHLNCKLAAKVGGGGITGSTLSDTCKLTASILVVYP